MSAHDLTNSAIWIDEAAQREGEVAVTISDILALIFGLFGVLSTLGLCAIWVGQQKAKRDEIERRVQALEASRAPDVSGRIDQIETRQREHDEMREIIVRLDERLTNLTSALNRQPEMVGQIVAAVLKEALRNDMLRNRAA